MRYKASSPKLSGLEYGYTVEELRDAFQSGIVDATWFVRRDDQDTMIPVTEFLADPSILDRMTAIRTPDSSTFSGKLARRYADAYTEANAIVVIGKSVKGAAVFLFVAIIIIGLMVVSSSGERNGVAVGISFAVACLIGIPTYVLGILVAAQGQTALATLDTAVNSSRHLKDEDVERVLSKRFSL